MGVAKKSKRYVSPERAAQLRALLAPGILAAGVFVNEPVESDAIAALHPYGVDVSSGIETDGVKDEVKMAAFVAAARREG